MLIEHVPTEFVLEYWDTVRPMLQKALDKTYGEFEIEDILDSILEKERQLHILGIDGKITAAAVTEVVIYPRRKSLRVHLLGGDLVNGWKQAVEDHMMRGAKAVGADQIEWVGRPGWQKHFEHTDKKAVRVVMIKEVH